MDERKRDELIRLRDLPPVAPVRWPEHISVTLARHLNRCPRAGYLYVATGGAAPTLEMDRGTLAHAAAALMMARRLEHEGDDEAPAAHHEEALSHWTAELVREAGERNPKLWVDHASRDIARLCTFHMALGLDVDPETLIGIERKFMLELECGWTVRGIVDLASMPSTTSIDVVDYKTSLHVPPENEWDSFQTKLYCAMIVFGRPVERMACVECDPMYSVGGPDVCESCGGRGWVEVPGEPIPGMGQVVEATGRELYPRHDPRKRKDGRLASVQRTQYGQPVPWTRLELQELLIDLNDDLRRLDEMLQSWDFPARSGTKACNECPAETLCPIPRGYRRFAGFVQSKGQAEEAWAWAQRTKALVAATEKEVKEFAAVNAVALELGDEVWAHQSSETRKLRTRREAGRSVADWEGLQEAIEVAADGGEALDLVKSGWLRAQNSSSFKKSARDADASSGPEKPAQRPKGEKDAGVDVERSRDERYGETLPE